MKIIWLHNNFQMQQYCEWKSTIERKTTQEIFLSIIEITKIKIAAICEGDIGF
jgi:hypothetical protein